METTNASQLPEEPITELPPGWRTGMPYYTRNLNTGTFLFWLLLKDGRTIEGYVQYEGQSKIWFEAPLRRAVPPDDIIGWREQYSCEDARDAIDIFVQRPQSIVARDGHWANANDRHLRPEEDYNAIGCRECAQYFVAQWCKRFNRVPQGWEEFS